ncbi:MAG: phosphate ABC transporter substrate-binding protein PstS [Gallionella sp.]|nr:phosphate ABC transporter substrate-binding protein PstS [Gallionella sp.]MDD4958874.1 phosphate ABC transporter substrate-binding protein PstS [Gallionella sp.]
MKLQLKKTLQALVVAMTLTSSQFCNAADISSGGATAPAEIFTKWASEYQAKTGIKIQYQAFGSGEAIDMMGNKTLDFGVTDMPLKPEELDKMGLIQFPIIMTGLVPVVHLNGIVPNSVKLDGTTLADIYLGKITRWNDPVLVALNPDLKLPDLAITVVHRADHSGSTFLFTNYLSKVNPAWQSSMGEGETVAWKAGQMAGTGDEGTTKIIDETHGAIGYVSYPSAIDHKLSMILLKNRAGQFIKPEDYVFQAAVMRAPWHKSPSFYTILTDESAKDAWPINAVSFVLLRKVQENADKGSKMLKFFDWVYHDNNDFSLELGFIPLPESLSEMVQDAWKVQIKDTGGKAIWQ